METVSLYLGTDAGVSIWRSDPEGHEELISTDVRGPVRAMRGSVTHPERVYAAVYSDGVYRTDDAGAHWTKVFHHDYVRALAIDPSNDDVVYVGTEPIQLHRSEDRGESWEELRGLQQLPDEIKKRWRAPGFPGLGHVRDIFTHPDDPRTIYLCLEHGGVVRSHDRGGTWEDVSDGIDYLDIHMISSLPGRLDRYYVATARGFFASDDPADGWVRAEKGFTRDYFHDFIFLPPARDGESPTMLVATADKSPGSWNRPEGARGALFRSFDCAESWHQVGEGLPESMEENVWAIAAHPNDRTSAFVGLGRAFRDGTDDSEGLLLVTQDRGDSWQPLDVQLPPVRALWAASS